jgi:predicted metal-binding protein
MDDVTTTGLALSSLARTLGASATAILPASRLPIDERFARMCGTPTPCPSYGLAPGCPPHAMQPEAFRRLVQDYQWVLVFKIDAPVSDLLGEQRLEIARRIHRIAAALEHAALNRGLKKAKGMAAGSCKELFCDREQRCAVLAASRPCRHPDLARPSISAVGVDFSALTAMLHWPFGKLTPDPAETDSAMGLMAGLVLLSVS